MFSQKIKNLAVLAALSLGQVAWGVDVITVDASGNVGIGTSSPADILDVQGKCRLNGGLLFAYPNDANVYQNLTHNSGFRYVANGYATMFATNGNGGGGFEFYTCGSGYAGNIATMTSQMCISHEGLVTINGNVGIGTTGPSQKLDVNGNVYVSGTLNKAACQFLIDHPLDPENVDLHHGVIEAPRYDLIYRGRVQLKNGQAAVSIDSASNMTEGTFAQLTQNPDYYLQNDTGWDPVKGRVENGKLYITCKDKDSTDTVRWMVVAERADPYIKVAPDVDSNGRLVPEQAKKSLNPVALQPRKGNGKTEETVDEARGTKGYVRHPQAFPNAKPLPKRQIIQDTTPPSNITK